MSQPLLHESGPATVLLVEDNPILLQGAGRALRQGGYEVMSAADGQAALALLQRQPHPPDLIVSDVTMPTMNGLDLLRAVRQNPSWLSIPFVFLTDCDDPEMIHQAYSLGADDYLLRPLDRDRLLLILGSKLKRQTELQAQTRAKQRALDAARDELTLMVAHELRTPLVGIRMATEILAREGNTLDPQQFREILEIIHSGGARMTRLVEQAIMVVMLQSGTLAESIASQSIPSPVRDAVIGAIARARQFDYRHKETPIQFDELDPDALVLCDLGALTHALAELLANAIAFATPGSPVQVTQWVSDERVWLTVTDYGPGIPAEELPHVFEPYRQVNRRKYEQQGIGIGLVLAREIIEAHHGTFELCSVTDRGTQVIMGLPLCRECEDEGDVTTALIMSDVAWENS